MPLHEVVVRTEYYNQECLNRYTYRSSGTPASVSLSFGLAAAMGYVQPALATEFETGSLAQAVLTGQSTQVRYVDILVRNIYNPVDFYNTPFNVDTFGLEGGSEAMSPAFAYGFRSERSRLDIRRGFKRYVGANEANVAGGGVLVGAWLSGPMTDIADKLGDTISYDDEGNSLQYEPVIISKEKYTTPSGNNAYRYYETEAEQLENVANAGVWQAYSEIRTQGSRQYGRGR